MVLFEHIEDEIFYLLRLLLFVNPIDNDIIEVILLVYLLLTTNSDIFTLRIYSCCWP